jgi:hypothetical protein
MPTATPAKQDVETKTFYMDRDPKVETEKPYELRFPPPEGFPARNTTWSEYSGIKVADIRGEESDFKVGENGFQLCHLDTSMTAEDFDDEEKIKTKFLKDVAHCVKSCTGAERVLVFDYSVRSTIH